MKKIYFIVLSMIFNHSCAFAGEKPSWNILSTWQPIVAFNLGPQWDKPGETRQFSLEPDIVKTYYASPTTQTLMGTEFFIGGQHTLNSFSSLQLGIATAITSVTSLHGEIWEDADPEFNNYWYDYQLAPFRTTLHGRWLFTSFSNRLTPYIDGGIGVSLNRAYNYQITSRIFEEVASPLYTSNVNVSLAYNIGVGIQHAINEHAQIGLGYEFSDWGQSSLGRAKSQDINAPLSLAHLYMNQLMVSLTYLF